MKAKIAMVPYARSTYHYKSWSKVRDETPFFNQGDQEMYRLNMSSNASDMSEIIDG